MLEVTNAGAPCACGTEMERMARGSCRCKKQRAKTRCEEVEEKEKENKETRGMLQHRRYGRRGQRALVRVRWVRKLLEFGRQK